MAGELGRLIDLVETQNTKMEGDHYPLILLVLLPVINTKLAVVWCRYQATPHGPILNHGGKYPDALD